MATVRLIAIVMLLGVCKLEFGKALYGFDCGDQITNVTTVSLIDIGDCNIEEPEPNITKSYVQILQLNDYAKVRVLRCLVKITRVITYCGMHSHASRVKNGEISYYKELTHEECERIYNTGYYTESGTIIAGLLRNTTINKNIVLAGRTDYQGNCKGSSYSDPYGTWEDVYVAGWIEIGNYEEYSPVHLESNKIILQDGVQCKFSELTCIDSDGSQAFWNRIPEDACGANKYSVLYEGYIDKVTNGKEARTLYTLETQDVTFALWKKNERPICGFRLMQTEHPKIFVLENAKNNVFVNKKPIETANLDIFTYMNSKFVYVEKHFSRQIKHLYYDILKKECELERRVISNALAIAAVSPADCGHKIMQKEGYLGVTAGEVIHLLKCTRVEVTPRKTKECFEQLPVYKGKEEYFLTPRTHVLVRSGKKLLCHRKLPIMYRINNVWYQMLPDAYYITAPEVLKPNTKPTWTYVKPTNLATAGIYNEKDTSRLKDLILFPIERSTVLHRVALGMSGREKNTDGLSIKSFFDTETLEAIATSTWKKMWSSFLAFGTASAGIIGILIIGRLIKLVVDTIIHGYAIYSIYGFSIHLLGAIWNSVTQLLLHLGNKNRQEREKRADNEDKEKKDNKNSEVLVRIYPKLSTEKGRVDTA